MTARFVSLSLSQDRVCSLADPEDLFALPESPNACTADVDNYAWIDSTNPQTNLLIDASTRAQPCLGGSSLWRCESRTSSVDREERFASRRKYFIEAADRYSTRYMIPWIKSFNLPQEIIDEVSAYCASRDALNEVRLRDIFHNQDELNMRALLDQGANLRLWKIHPQWIAMAMNEINGSPPTRDQVNQMSLWVCRNFYLRPIVLNEDSVKYEVGQIMEQRRRYGRVPLFADRHVMLVAHNEQLSSNFSRSQWGEDVAPTIAAAGLLGESDSDNRFGTSDLETGIWLQSNYVSHFRVRPDERDGEQVKQEILAEIIQAQRPFTFFFNGHGCPEGIFLNDCKRQDVFISATELAAAFIERARNLGEVINLEDRDIVILNCCHSTEIMLQIYWAMQQALQSERLLPIGIAEAEFGQAGFSNFANAFGSDINEALLSDDATLNSVFEYDSRHRRCNPAVFIPGEDDFVQVADRTVPEGVRGPRDYLS